MCLTRSRYALDITSLDEDVAAVLPEELRRNVADDLLDFVNVLKTLRDQLSKVFQNQISSSFLLALNEFSDHSFDSPHSARPRAQSRRPRTMPGSRASHLQMGTRKRPSLLQRDRQRAQGQTQALRQDNIWAWSS